MNALPLSLLIGWCALAARAFAPPPPSDYCAAIAIARPSSSTRASSSSWTTARGRRLIRLANNDASNDAESADPSTGELKIIFSDVDGALIHYPKTLEEIETALQQGELSGDNRILALPPSATGMKGIISSKTLAACCDLRKKHGVKLVLVSGMRTSTLLNRLPYLPKADAYCTEAGGRIFYPTEGDVGEWAVSGTWTPLEYSGAEDDDLTSFGLREDRKWRRKMEMTSAAGKDGYAGNEVSSNRCDDLDEDDEDEECLIDYDNPIGFPKQEEVIPIREREGKLWDYARLLTKDMGFVLDTKSYSTCFRVNKKHQKVPDIFGALLDGGIDVPAELEKSTNLGCIDIYPVSSGKRNCCQYLADEMGFSLSAESVCICDDDNDMEMALACSHAYIPAVTSQSVAETMRAHPDKFTQTLLEGSVAGTSATEAALELIAERAALGAE